MKCDYCGCDLIIAKNKMESPLDTENITSVQTLVCTNTACEIYAGRDLSNPLQVAKTLRTLV